MPRMQNAMVTTAGEIPATDTDIEQRLETFRRWQPYGLLGIATLLAATTAELMPTTTEWGVTAALVVGAFALQLWWGRAARNHPGPNRFAVAYYAVRWLFGLVLTLINGFFAFYAAAGYFDAEKLIPGRRMVRLGLFACSIPVASAQAGGLTLHDSTKWAVFAGLLLANNALLTIVGYFSEKGEEQSRARATTIAELERTNAALQQALDENAALHAQLLVQAREAGVADERRRLAAEIHDTIAQGLTGIIAQLQIIAHTPDPANARRHVDNATELARHSLSEARRSVRNLAPAGLHDGLPRALRKTAAQWSERTGVRADFTLTGTAQHLNGEVSATFLRIAQEAMSNTAKHASASRVGITLSFMDDEVVLDVWDDGQGFDPLALPAHTDTGGFGLEGMRGRAERIAGAFTVESERGRGTAVSVRVPLVNQGQ
ncbi:sensor histidine kinase [Actinomadura sp. WAC 06369]|uniref:sensor histidine kinase n=1 Tax=Actinomadura sp. WAC 06369 TaxID=2203193 RepID=UPI001F3D156D|nr:sensor histidine kinase [Actinomadura sp. WAC 06369]